MASRITSLLVLLALATLLLVSCQKTGDLAGPSPANPSNILGPNKGGPVTYVYPTGGDDAANILAALQANEPGGTVMLTEGTFYLGSAVHVHNFSGTLRGAGKDKTIVTTLPGDKIEATPIHCWGGIKLSTMFYFEGGGDISVSDLSMVVTDPAPAVNQDAFGDALASPLVMDGLDRNTRVERARFQGAPGALYPWNMLWGTCVVGYAGPPEYQYMVGDHLVESCDYEMTGFIGYVTQYQTDGRVAVENSSFANMNRGVSMQDHSNCDVKISRNEIVDALASGVWLYQGYWLASGIELSPSRFLIEHNTIRSTASSSSDGIQLIDNYCGVLGDKTMEAAVTNNKISLDTEWGGITDYYVQDAVITNNIIEGTMMSAIYVGVSGLASPNWTILGNNVQRVHPYFPGFDATIWLGPATSHCTVVGGSNKTNVFDEGTDNIVVGVTKVGGEGLGEHVKEGMQEKMRIRKDMLPW